MIQYYSVKIRKHTSKWMSLVRDSRTVETIRIYYQGPHSNANNVVLNLKWFCSLVASSF